MEEVGRGFTQLLEDHDILDPDDLRELMFRTIGVIRRTGVLDDREMNFERIVLEGLVQNGHDFACYLDGGTNCGENVEWRGFDLHSLVKFFLYE